MKYPKDPHSFAQPNEAVVKHLDLNINVDFKKKVISGTATWKIEAAEDAQQIIFDTDELTIQKVTVDGQEVTFVLGEPNDILGQQLIIPVTGDAKQVAITYETSPSAAALQWLSAQQTHEENFPFLFTQSQAILARTWIPCQDSPGIRFTYNATVKCPEAMIALMSANNPQQNANSGQYSFFMDQPIPAYLMALVVGDVKYADISNRTGIYAEKGLLDQAEWEFADMDRLVEAAEKLYGPYAWGRYDMIILPPSFPFGGMENPKLTFATPTIMAGDRSLVSLVAHELAHSWSGNLVTNSTWNDFWLNEGFTVYFEQRIMEEVYGVDYSEMLASLSYDGLVEEIAEFMETRPEDTHLKLNLEGRNPDDGMNSIAYDKGYLFLRLIEETIGRERWDAFLRAYFENHKFKGMDTEKFVDILSDTLLTPEQMSAVDVQAWIYGPGLPKNAPHPLSDRFLQVEKHLKNILEKDQWPADNESGMWSSHEWIHFINQLPEDITIEQLTRFDERYKFSESGNSEILAAWFKPTIKAGYEPVKQVIEDFLIRVGRRKFLTPTYRAMIDAGKKDWAKEVYAKARPNYHSVAQETMDKLLQ